MSEKRPPRTLAERILAPIAEVRQAEVPSVVLMFLTMLLLLAAYYLLKTAREALILTHGGAEVKTYSSAGQAVLLLFIIPAYSALASRVDRRRLLGYATLFFVSNLIGFALFGQATQAVGVIFFLWLGLFGVMIIAQFWGFANDLYTPEQGKRVFPVIALGSNLGAWLGSAWASQTIASVGPFSVMLIGAAVLSACLAMAIVVNRYHRRTAPPEKRAEAAQPLGKDGAFELIRRDRYLFYITIMSVLINVVTTSNDYLFGSLLVDEANARFGADPAGAEARERFVGATYGRMFSYINLAGFLMQLLLVSRVFKYLGVVNALLVHPMISLTGNLLMMGRPSLGLMAGFKVADASTDYSIDNTARQALWLPTSREAKYKAKQAVDTFFVRVGDMIQAGLIYTGSMLAFSIQGFAAANVVMAVIWLATVLRLRPMYEQKAALPAAAPAPQRA